MIIIVSDLKKRITELNKSIDKYDEDLLNIENIFVKIKEIWLGEIANAFLEKVELENRKINNNIIELKQLVSVYENIIIDYSNLGNKIFFDFRNKDYVNSLLDDYLTMVLEIMNVFESIHVKYYFIIEKYRMYFKEMIEKINSIRCRYNAILNYLSEKENKIATKSSKIFIEIIKHSDFKM